MKTRVFFLISFFATLVSANPPAKDGNLPMVFDPATKKYFIGGSSKFLLRQGDQSSFIERIEVSVDGGEYQPYGTDVKFGSEGKHTMKFRAIGSVNNWSPVQFIEVFVDLTAPTSEAKFPQEKNYNGEAGKVYVAQDSTLDLIAQDNLSGIATLEYSWDGQNFVPYTSTIKFEKAGDHTLHYRSVDRVGNTELAKKMTVTVDASAPSSTLALQGNAKPTNINKQTYVSDSVAFAITATDEGSKVKQTWVSVDGAAETQYIKPLYFLNEGAHKIKYRSVDNVGNKEETKEFGFYTVSIPPKTIANPLSKVVNTGGINFARSDFQLKLETAENVVGVDRVEFKMDQEKDFHPYLEPIRFTKPGFHTISYQSVDRAGNVEPTKSYSLQILDAPPETTVAAAQPFVTKEGVIYSPAPNILSFNVSNSPVGIKETLVSINDSAFSPYQGPITVGADRKVYKITYKSVDRLGNEETPRTLTLNMISAIPIVELFISNGQSNEERVRTNYLEGADEAKGAKPSTNDTASTDDKKPSRVPTSLPQKKK